MSIIRRVPPNAKMYIETDAMEKIDTTATNEFAESLKSDTCESLSAKAERENNLHKKKLLDMCENYTEEEARIACAVFAKKYPEIMYAALGNEHKNLMEFVKGLRNLNKCFDKELGDICEN